MGMVHLGTHWCETCDRPTLHRQIAILDDGEEGIILRCERCGNDVDPETGEDDGPGL